METNYWFCDTCGKKIDTIEEGYLQWLKVPTDENTLKIGKGMKIVHHNPVCMYNDQTEFRTKKALVSDMDLEHFSKSDGLVRLLEMISDQDFEDVEEVLEVIKRIHTPGYEKTRPYFREAISEGVFEPNTKLRYFSQRDLKAIENQYHLN